MLMKRMLASQVQRESCAYFSCQVRKLFLYSVALCEQKNRYNNNRANYLHTNTISRNKHLSKPLRLATKFDVNFVCRHYTRHTANTTLNGMDTIKLTDYDAIGFDLDNTLVRYQLTEMVDLEYKVLAQFLITSKGYASQRLLRPMNENIDFLQRGLILDLQRGNILKIAYDGCITKACHGTKQLSDEDIVGIYGPTRRWIAANQFVEDPLIAWHGPLADELRALLDYFDMPVSLVFARLVDTLDEANNNQPLLKYNIFPDILDGLCEIFTWEHFENDRSKYFASVKVDPQRYIRGSEDSLRNWLIELRKHKTLFLLTGSHVDFANFTASFTFGDDWRDLFDSIICFAKKPGFFMGERPFLKSQGTFETCETVTASDMKLGEIYTQGNYTDFIQCLSAKTNKVNPKVLYFGDNLLQDVFAPKHYCNIDTIAITEEMLGEGINDYPDTHQDKQLLCSNFWGPYYVCENGKPTVWLELMRKYAKFCIPDIHWLANQPIDKEIKVFSQQMCLNGFFPKYPKCFQPT